jgi:beta-lactamase regulating signal transducer with metallopeptidase domain/thiol-disulfide isomerase/thioredoxin/uncharacterized GH25 family protein
MNLLQALAESPVIQRAGWTLLHSAWQGLAVAIGLALVLPAVRRRGARAAYAVCCVALLLMVILPASTFFVLPDSVRTAATAPAMPVPARLSTASSATASNAHGANVTAANVGTPMAAEPARTARRLPPVVFISDVSGPQTVERATATRRPESHRGVATPLAVAAQPSFSLPSLGQRALSLWRQIPDAISAWLPWAVYVWTVGVLALSLWNVAGWFAVQRLKSRATSPVSSAIQEAAARISQKLGLARGVRLLQSALLESPIVIGALRPVILLPASLITELPADQLESLLAHELAHVLRQDYLVNLLQTVIETLLFYHPAVWWVSSKVRAERENCCDDLAVGIAADRAIYVRALAAVAGARASAIAPAATGGILLPRLRRILGVVDPQSAHPSRWLTGAVMLTLCGGAIALMAVNMRSATAQSKSAETAVTKAAPAKDEKPAKPSQPAAALVKDVPTTDHPGFPTNGSMRIRVTDEAGRPVPLAGVLVGVWTQEQFTPKNRRYTCDDQGVVTVDLPKSLWLLRLWATKKGYCKEFQNFETDARVHELKIPDEFTFHMLKETTLSGTVKNEEGKPVQGARVECFYERNGYPEPDPTVTDAGGRWKFDKLRPGFKIQIRATHADYVGHEMSNEPRNENKLTLQATETQLPPIVLRHGTRAVVKVTDPAGRPVEGAVVLCGNDQYFRLSENVRTEADGTCRLPAFAAGPMPVTILAKGWMPDSRKVEIGPKMGPVAFELKSGKRLRIRFVDRSGAPIPKVFAPIEQWRGVRHLLFNRSGETKIDIPETADKRGVLEWSWAPDDPITFNIMQSGFASITRTITADDNEHVVAMDPVLRITGVVKDAATNRMFDNFLVIPILYFQPGRPYLDRTRAQKQTRGRFGMQFDRTDAEHGLQVEAPGYQTFRLRQSYRVGVGDLTYSVSLKPGKRYTGRVLDADGRPVKGARVGVASRVEQLSSEILTDQPQGERSSYCVTTDADGSFEIPSHIDRYALAVVASAGFAEVERPANETPGEIRLKHWARVTGRLVQSGKPVPNCEIFLNPIRTNGDDAPRTLVHWTTTSANDGSFTFERVPPIPCYVEAWLHWGRPSPLKSSRSLPLSLSPGETADITLGGPGNDVTGLLVAENQPPGFDYHFALNYLVAKRPGIEPPAFLASKGFDWHKGWSDSWRNSPEGRAYLATLHTWFVKPEPDGRFHISGVEPGEYDFAVNLYGTTEGCLVHPLAMGVVHFSVKPGDKQLDLGKLSIPSLTLPKIGDLAGDFAIETPSGVKTSLAALRGNYVLVDFWATWCGACVAKLDAVEHLRKQFAGDKPLVVVGANLDADRQQAKDFLKQRPLLWQHALLGEWSNTDVPRRFAISGIPAYILIGPDGRILAHEISVEAIEAKFDQLTGKDPGTQSRVIDTRSATAQIPTPSATQKAATSKGSASKDSRSKTEKSRKTPKPVVAAAASRPRGEEPQFPTKGKMRIRVTDAAGKPVPAAGIHASIWTKEKFRANQKYTCDSDGLVDVDLPKTLSILRLWVAKRGYCEEFKNFQTNTAVHTLVLPDEYQFRLVKGTVIGGVVNDVDGRPIKGAKVAYCYDGVFFNDDTPTDAKGEWKFDNVRPGKEVVIRVMHPDYLSDHFGEMQKAQKVTTAMLRAQTATIVMRRGLRITGKVTDPAGKPVKRAILLSGDDPYFGQVTAPVVTDEQGQFRFPEMAAGPIRLTVVAKGWMPETRQIQIAAGMPSTDFQMKRGKKLRIRFVDRAGTPISKVEVQIEQWNAVRHLITEPNWRVRLDIPDSANKQGVFEWDWAPGDVVKYNFSKDGYAWIREAPVTADDRDHVQVLTPVLQISGTVRDAVTGRQLESFLAVPVIHFRAGFAALERSQARQEQAGRFALEFDRTDAEHGVQIEAPGYRAFRTSHRWRNGDADAVLDIRLEPSPRYVGSVVDEKGQAVKDAHVYLASASDQFSLYRIREVGAADIDRNARVQTDANGGFEIASPFEKCALIALSRNGYGEVVRAASELPGQIRIQRWAKVSGRLVQSGKPVPNCNVMLSPIRVVADDDPHVFTNLQTNTGDDGSFVFERVPPVPSQLSGRLHFSAPSPLTSGPAVPLKLAPGKTVDVMLGSPGIDVTGQLVAENQPPGFDYHFAINYLVAKRPGIEPPAFLAGKGFDWRKGWSDSWRNSPEGKAYLETLQTWFVKPEPNGRFRISGVEPGEYDFAVNLYGSTEGCLVHPIAQRVVHISVKPGDKQLDLGKVSIPSLSLPKIGDVAGDFAFETPSGAKTSLAALRGNYVLVDFWATWCGACISKLDAVEHLREQFAGDKPLVVVGANLDADRQQAKDFLKKRPLPWQHALLGDWSTTDVPQRFAISAVPSYILIGPDGRILAHEFALEAIEAKLKDLSQKQHASVKPGS